MTETKEILKRAKKASIAMLQMTEEKKNLALKKMSESLSEFQDEILSANKIDMENAKGKISDVMLDRLFIDEKRIKSMQKGIEDVILLPDPVGKILSSVKRGDLVIEKVSVPLGVVGIIYESRPNVTSDAASLTVKSGNVAVLRSGKEAKNTAKAIVDAMRHGLEKAGFEKDFVNLIEDTSRDSANEMMCANGYIDMLIPRGGKGLIRACVENATVPCIETGTGICHIYIDESCDIDMALNIVENAKTSRPSVCNACEVIVVHKNIAKEFLPRLYERLVTKREEKGLQPVKFFLDDFSYSVIKGEKADEESFNTEFLDYVLAVKTVDSVKEAVEHISTHSTHHSESIVTENKNNAEYFMNMIDSAAVYHNASTRFTDGGEFGLGCEMGISTQKLHARGPMGLEELCSYKYKIFGNGNIR